MVTEKQKLIQNMQQQNKKNEKRLYTCCYCYNIIINTIIIWTTIPNTIIIVIINNRICSYYNTRGIFNKKLGVYISENALQFYGSIIIQFFIIYMRLNTKKNLKKIFVSCWIWKKTFFLISVFLKNVTKNWYYWKNSLQSFMHFCSALYILQLLLVVVAA